MSRRLQTNSRSVKPAVSLRLTQSKQKSESGIKGKQRTKKGAVLAKTYKKKAASVSDVESTTSGGASLEDFDGDDSEQADDESDEVSEPDLDAPSHYVKSVTGPRYDEEPDNLSENGDWAGFPATDLDEANFEPDVVGEIDAKLFDSDDDLVYERVNEVSDSDEAQDDDAVERAETELMLGEFEDDLTSHFANQIDGMSAYGFGTDSEGSIAIPFSESDDALEPYLARHVRFEEPRPVGVTAQLEALADSPTMTRALLPSALPAEADQAQLDTADDGGNDGNDTDATEELDAPEKAWAIPRSRSESNVEEPSSPETPMKRSPGQKGPVRGTFIDDGDKVTAILDPTGKKLLLSDPHLLGGVFARRYGPSAPASPTHDFAEAVFGSTSTSTSHASDSEETRPQSRAFSSANLISPTILQSDSNPDAFANAAMSLNDFISQDLFSADDVDPEEAKLSIDDMIVFDSDSDTDADHPFVSSFRDAFSTPNTPLAHLTTMNVTAFRQQHAGGSHFASPSAPHTAPLRNKFMTPLKRKKRDRKHDSPYNDAHYQGVTPVQRVSYTDHADLSSSPAPSRMLKMGHKRRKTLDVI